MYGKMKFSESLQSRYTQEQYSAREAQRLAEFIAWGPEVFQVARIMLKHGVLQLLRDNDDGLTVDEVAEQTIFSPYAAKCLLEASLSISLVLIDPESGRYRLAKTGWFLINDPATRVNIDFNHDVNYQGMFALEQSLLQGKPEGLRSFGDWPTIYEGLSQLPEEAQKSWMAFDHFYSDSSFGEALRIVYDDYGVRTLYDVGGNTGKWALASVAHNNEAEVTVIDLPQQIEMMQQNITGKTGAERIKGVGMNLLNPDNAFPQLSKPLDGIWMSQFLDCFSMPQIVSVLSRAVKVMDNHTHLFIMETLWDRQKYEPAALCLTMTSLYFTAMANGNSKMYHTDDLMDCVQKAGLEVEKIFDHLGQGHSILVCKKR